MGLPACFHLADDVFPRVRAEAARRLVGGGWSQSRTADTLHVSQAMVSKYVARADPEDDALVLRLVEDLLHDVEVPAASNGPSRWCQTLAPADARPDAQDALEDLLEAERRLTMDPPIRLVPQIGLNIARAIPQARGAEDILAFPGRLVAAGNRLISPVPPAWGASHHLAAGLLALQSAGAQATALANIRADDGVRAAAQAIGLDPITVRRSTNDGDDGDDGPVLRCFAEGATCVDDPGAHGIEPCFYIAGASARDVAHTIQRIHQGLPP